MIIKVDEKSQLDADYANLKEALASRRQSCASCGNSIQKYSNDDPLNLNPNGSGYVCNTCNWSSISERLQADMPK